MIAAPRTSGGIESRASPPQAGSHGRAPGDRGARRTARPRLGALVAGALASACASALVACGSSGAGVQSPGERSSPPAFLTAPRTREQKLVAKGAQLVVADGCSACHLSSSSRSLGPSFASLAGEVVTLGDGRRVTFDERFVREALRRPYADAIKGYDPAVMAEQIERLGLDRQPGQIEALAAFIEQVGPP